MRIPRPVALIVLLAAGSGWLAWSAFGQKDVAPPAPAGNSKLASDETAMAPSVVSPTASPDAAVAVLRRAAEPRTALVAIPEDARWIDVRIVDGATQAPVPDAEVAWYDQTVASAVGRRPELLPCLYGTQQDHEAMARLFGWHTRSDRDGVARVHISTTTTVVARQDENYGLLVVGKEHVAPLTGFTLVLQPDAAVRIRVLDTTGQPVLGAPVAWVIVSNAGAFVGYRGHGPEATSQAPDGIATLPHLQRWRSTYDYHRGLGNHWRASLYWPGQESNGVVIDFDAPPREPVELRVPPFGSVRARLAEGVVAAAHAAAIQLSLPHDFGAQRQVCTLRSHVGTDGWAVFPIVPLGQRWQARGSIDGGSLENEFLGPTAAGVTVDVRIGAQSGQTMLTGRLLDEERQPLPSCMIRLQFGENSFKSAMSNNDGEFRLVMRPRPEGEPPIVLQVRGVGPDKRWRLATLPPRDLRASVEHLGDVVLEPEPLLAAGRFVVVGAPQGFPNAGAKVERAATADGEPTWRYLPDSSFMRLSADAFEVRGPIEPGRYRIRTTSRDFLSIEPIEFLPGIQDLLVELRPATGLAATVLTPDVGVPQVSGRLTAAADEEPADPSRLLAYGIRHSERRLQFTWNGIAAGTYRVELLLPGFTEPVVVIEDVQVPPPEGGDARLVDIDLGQAVRVQSLRVLDTEGQMLRGSGAMFALPLRAQSQALTLLASAGDLHRVLLPNRPVELLFTVPGYRPQTVRCAGPTEHVRLEPWPTIPVRLREPVELPEGCELAVLLRPKDPPPGWPEVAVRAAQPSRQATVFAGGLAQVPIGDGEHEVVVSMRRGPKQVDLELPPQSASLLSPSVTVHVPQAAIAAGLLQVSARR